MTAQRFVPDPFLGDGSRLYRTGDLARRLENGDLEYLGRIDDQVKIRGFRIELGEIEAVLATHPDVAECVVVAREDVASDKRLVAYLVSGNESDPPAEELKTHLRAQLPEYMVPAHFVPLGTLPLTPNGKVDRKALPAPDLAREDSQRPFVAPRTPTEETLAEVWAAVLGVPRVSVDDNFFELGGDSILTIQVIARCRQAGLQFTPRDLAKQPSIAAARGGRRARGAVDARGARGIGTAPLAPTPIQSWFFEQRFADPHHWNQAFLFEVRADVDVDVLEQALGHVVARHDALRLRVGRGQPRLDVDLRPERARPVDRADRSHAGRRRTSDASAIETAAATAQARLDLERGPLLAAVHFDRGDGPGRLLLAIHHLAVDGVSWRILIEDLEAAYRALQAGAPVELPTPSASFRRWSQALDGLRGDGRAGRLPGRLAEHRRGGRDPADGRLGARREHGGARRGRRRCPSIATRPAPCSSGFRRRTARRSTTSCSPPWRWRSAPGRAARPTESTSKATDARNGSGPSTCRARSAGSRRLYPVALDLEGAQDEGSAAEARQGRASSSAGPGPELRRSPLRVTRSGRPRTACHLPAGRAAVQLPRPVRSGRRGFGAVPVRRRADGAWHGPANERTHRLEVVAARARRPIRGPLDLRRRARPAGGRRTPRRRLHTRAAPRDRALHGARGLRLHPVRFPARSARAGRPRPARRAARRPRGRLSRSRRCSACSSRWRPEAAGSGSSNGSSASGARWTPRRCAKPGRRPWRATRSCEPPSSPTWGTSRSRS